MNIRLLILTLILSLCSSLALAGNECKTSRRLTVAQQIANIGVDTSLDIFDLDIFPGGSVAAGYEYEVEPAFTNGLYFRTDRWQVSLKAIPEKDINLSEGVDFGVSGGLKNQTEATFIRSFNDPCQAMFAKPYAPNRIPLTVKKAIGKKFDIGNYFLLRSSLGFVVSGSLLNTMGSAWGLSIGASYLIEGYYQLQIVRLDETHVRLKIIAHRGKGISANAGVGYQDNFEVFKVSLLDNALERWVDLNPIRVEAHKSSDQVMMVDYVLDLADPEVGEAYESLLKKIKDFRNIALAKPFANEKNLQANLILDLTPLEDIYSRDYQSGNVERLKRNLRASSNQDSRGLGMRLGNRILGYKWGSSISDAQMSVRRPDNTLDYYLLRSWDSRSEGRVFYSWYKTRHENGLRALFTTDKDYKIDAPLNMVRYQNSKKSKMSYDDFKDIKLQVKKALPVIVERQIPWSDWDQRKNKKFTNFGLRLQLILSPEVIVNAPELSRNEVQDLFKDHLKSKGLTAEDFYVERVDGGSRMADRESPESQLNAELFRFSYLLEKALDRDRSMLRRLNAITKLRKNKLFLECGFSFMLALRPDKMESMLNLDLNISSNEAQIDFQYGDSELSALYKKLLTIKAALDDDSLDLLREAESLSAPKPLMSLNL
jgi:hypothetical protein